MSCWVILGRYCHQMFVTITTSLQDIFVTLSELDNEKYFMCQIDDFKFLADMIEHVPLQLRVRYVFCCAPIMRKQPFICTMFLKVRLGGGVKLCNTLPDIS